MGIINPHNTTLPTIRPWDDAVRRWSSFELYPMYEDLQMALFRGVMYQPNNYWSKEDVVVKTFMTSLGQVITEEAWQPYIRAAEEAAKHTATFTEFFLNHNRNNGSRVGLVFNTAGVAVMDSISDFMPFLRFVKGFKKTFAEDECVLIEPYIPGDIETFVSRAGVVLAPGTELLQAFCHFTYWQSKGNLVISNLKGVRKGHKYRLSVPHVHSQDKTFGPADEGEPGIINFFENHSCNSLCRSWTTPAKERRYGTFKTPSAPVSPDVCSSTANAEIKSSESEEKDSTHTLVMAQVHQPPDYFGVTPMSLQPPPYEQYIGTDKNHNSQHSSTHQMYPTEWTVAELGERPAVHQSCRHVAET